MSRFLKIANKIINEFKMINAKMYQYQTIDSL